MKLLVYLLLPLIVVTTADEEQKEKVFVIVEPSRNGASYLNFLESTKHHGIQVTELESTHDNHKHELLHQALEPLKTDSNAIVLYSASQDIVFTKPLSDIVKSFQESEARILFAADDECLPNAKYENEFPPVQGFGLRFINADLIIGYASDMYQLTETVTDDDDQLYFLKKYLNRGQDSTMKIDHYSEIFQVLTSNSSVKLNYNEETKTYMVRNENHWTEPGVLLGRDANGIITLNHFIDYINNARDNKTCYACGVDKITLNEEKLPTITIGVYIFYRSPYLQDYLDKIANLNYPKSKISVLIASVHKLHERLILDFKKNYANEYAKIKYMGHEYNYSQLKLLQIGMEYAAQRKSDYYFVTDSAVHIENANTLRDLIELNKDFVAPIMVRPTTTWSNFWGALSPKGFYRRSFDYIEIVENQVRGVWNVPYVAHVYLLRVDVIPKLSYEFAGSWFDLGKDFMDDPEMTLCNNARRAGLHIFATNLINYGHLVHIDKTSGEMYPDLPLHLHEFYDIINNPEDWHARYIHPDYWKYRNGSLKPESPCPDVYRFHIVTERFCSDLIEVMETLGQWSNGTNSDPRLPGGYESVPTVDVHMDQVGLEAQWQEFLRRFVMPLQQLAFEGYYHDPPKIGLAFVVRYRKDEQPLLRPHNDASTYTINIALNNRDEDYQGGGTRFVRYDCTVLDTKKGWMLMHPGRLTHYHEGLPTTGGTRYIAVSFNDP